MADKKISELDQTLILSDQADFPLSQDNGGEPTTFRAKLTQIATKIAEAITFSNLKTGNKQLVSAVNQTISNLADDFNTTAGSTYAKDDCVLYNGILYQCIKNSGTTSGTFIDADWTAIKAVDVGSGGGGGGGTTDYEDLSNKPQVNSVELVGNKSLDDLGIMPASLSKTVSGSLVHIEDGADNVPVKSLVSEIVAVQSGSGTPSPSNPRAISGFDSGVITRCGKNLLVNRRTTTTLNGVTFTVNSDGSITLSGTASTSFQFNLNDSPLKSAKYTMSNGNTNLISGISLFAVTPSGNKDVNRIKGFVTFEDSVSIVALWITSGTNTNGVTIKPMIELGDTATPYEPYNGNTYTFAFGQTVFGGHFDNKGNLVVTHEIIDLGDLTYTYYTGGANPIFYGSITGAKAYSDGDTINAICSCYDNFGVSRNRTNLSSLLGDNQFSFISNGTNLTIRNDSYTDANAFKTAMTGQKVVFELANPITLAITSQDIPTLLGENNIFSNCGDVEVDYYTDNADEIVEVAKATASTPLHNYSEDEQIVGTWVDGSTVYEKTIIFLNQALQGGDTALSLGVTNMDIVVESNALITNSAHTNIRPINSWHLDSASSQMWYRITPSSGELMIHAESSWATPNIYVTIRYTKSV